ncbi:MAG: phosphonate C-P lyase system protein PhnG [Spirochaetales bacterium]|nr:phosphonate C-P lyase system protein PhnG [Spirochaetales bacterium]
MKQEEIFALFMQAEHDDIIYLANEFKKEFDYEIIRKPEQGLVMFRAEETVEKLDFNVGEILMTTAEIKIANVLGYSMIMGMNNEKALDCAVILGVYEAISTQQDKIIKLAKQLKLKNESRLREEREIASSTRVHFEVMGGQDPNVKKYHQG